MFRKLQLMLYNDLVVDCFHSEFGSLRFFALQSRTGKLTRSLAPGRSPEIPVNSVTKKTQHYFLVCESPDAPRCIFPVNYIHRRLCQRNTEVISFLHLGDQPRESWLLDLKIRTLTFVKAPAGLGRRGWDLEFWWIFSKIWSKSPPNTLKILSDT